MIKYFFTLIFYLCISISESTAQYFIVGFENTYNTYTNTSKNIREWNRYTTFALSTIYNSIYGDIRLEQIGFVENAVITNTTNQTLNYILYLNNGNDLSANYALISLGLTSKFF